jgi:cytochrome c
MWRLSLDGAWREQDRPVSRRIFGSKSGSVPGYDFSPALKTANITWDETALDKFLENPAADVHGTKMFISVPSTENRQNIIAYLKTLKP